MTTVAAAGASNTLLQTWLTVNWQMRTTTIEYGKAQGRIKGTEFSGPVRILTEGDRWMCFSSALKTKTKELKEAADIVLPVNMTLSVQMVP